MLGKAVSATLIGAGVAGTTFFLNDKKMSFGESARLAALYPIIVMPLGTLSFSFLNWMNKRFSDPVFYNKYKLGDFPLTNYATNKRFMLIDLIWGQLGFQLLLGGVLFGVYKNLIQDERSIIQISTPIESCKFLTLAKVRVMAIFFRIAWEMHWGIRFVKDIKSQSKLYPIGNFVINSVWHVLMWQIFFGVSQTEENK